MSLSSLPAQTNQPAVISIETFFSVDRIRPGDEFKIGVEARIDGEWHINSNKPRDEFLIPTLVRLDSVEGLEFAAMNYPQGKLKRFEFSQSPLSVYEGKITIWTRARASENLKQGRLKISGRFSYQACNDVACLAPAEVPFEMVALVTRPDSKVNQINASRFSNTEGDLAALQGVRESSENRITKLIAGKGLFITLFFVFLGGLALNLTPCVYPLIPITISYFAGQASNKLSKSFLLALLYVLGMSVTYSLLGVVAAMTGGLLGASLQNPLVLIGIAAIFLVFAASMFGAFEIRIPSFLVNFAGGAKQGIWGSIFMGLTVGIVAAPCIGPFVLSLLTYVAVQGDPLIGFLMFLILSLGLGLPFLVLGTFSGLIKNLPRSGEWMAWVKKVFGVIMIGVAIYFISTLIPEIVYVAVLTAIAVIGGLLVGFLDKSKASFSWFNGLKMAVGTVLILFGIWTSVSAWNQANRVHISWQNYSETLVAQARVEGRPVLIDFFADWCIPCKQIDKTLFSEPAVVAKAEQFTALKADLTKNNSEQVKSLRKKFNVHGVPTVILLDSDGNEYKRFTDELISYKPNQFLEMMEKIVMASGS